MSVVMNEAFRIKRICVYLIPLINLSTASGEVEAAATTETLLAGAGRVTSVSGDGWRSSCGREVVVVTS